ncbi:type II toxin-antitoxin system RelE/ParE family toxin [Pseudomonas sp. CFBP 13711]|uniref:type II toxin-antitoxin system RelE/ParE family toxin n=1 Tax=unclassified Pseudomonas TaxID=196821 RepID=UPI001785A1F3|nr:MULTISPECIES: type II toxin-antitoxin system RelE/ParE family toxin [unclassified Pseudomonas]MBD8707011.1 type II toxin-antitoxin system RelE/ParE family toxin [Pseudomonas sp. CFBP 13711]MBD8712835.1 type II toxin-antitoxin system RelE/ParE family toxin [Pseudomonas sp. CFBP 13715]
MSHYRISSAARADIIDTLKHSQAQFGDQARQRYQALILEALQLIANAPHRIGSCQRDELAPGLRSFHLTYARQHARHIHGPVKSPRHLELYRVAKDEAIEVVRLLHDAMEVELHVPRA